MKSIRRMDFTSCTSSTHANHIGEIGSRTADSK